MRKSERETTKNKKNNKICHENMCYVSLSARRKEKKIREKEKVRILKKNF